MLHRAPAKATPMSFARLHTTTTLHSLQSTPAHLPDKHRMPCRSCSSESSGMHAAVRLWQRASPEADCGSPHAHADAKARGCWIDPSSKEVDPGRSTRTKH